MRLRILFILVSGLLGLPVTAQRITWGLEWGIAGTVFSHHDYQYTTLEGHHIDQHFNDAQFHVQGLMTARIGLQTSRRLNVSLVSGWQGLQYEIRCIPVSLRVTYAMGADPEDAGISTFLEGGIGIKENLKGKEGYFAKTGLSYRIPLGYGTRLCMNAAAQGSFCQPAIYDPYDTIYVDESHLEYSYRFSLAPVVSISLEF